MTSQQAKALIDTALEEFTSYFKKDTLVYSRNSVICTNTTADGASDELFVDAYFAISDQPLKDDEGYDSALFFPIECDIDENGECNESALKEAISKLTEQIKAIAERINASTDEEAKKTFCLILAEEKAKEDAKHQAELERLNRDIKRNVMIGIIGAVALGIVALVCILVDKLF